MSVVGPEAEEGAVAEAGEERMVRVGGDVRIEEAVEDPMGGGGGGCINGNADGAEEGLADTCFAGVPAVDCCTAAP